MTKVKKKNVIPLPSTGLGIQNRYIVAVGVVICLLIVTAVVYWLNQVDETKKTTTSGKGVGIIFNNIQDDTTVPGDDTILPGDDTTIPGDEWGNIFDTEKPANDKIDVYSERPVIHDCIYVKKKVK